VRTSLTHREDGGVDALLEVESLTLPEEDHTTARSTKRLVGGGGHNVSVVEWALADVAGDEARDVGHVAEEEGTTGVSDSAKASIVPLTWVGRATTEKELWAEKHGLLLELVVVDETSVRVNLSYTQ